MSSRVKPTFNFSASFCSNPRWVCLIDIDGDIFTIQLKQQTLNLPLKDFLYAIQRYVNEAKEGER